MENETKQYLYPSTLFASAHPVEVTTILGSCVAVCLYDPVLRIGGINHYMLPLWNGDGLASPKFGNIAIERLLEKMVRLGSRQGCIKAKIFGGGEVIQVVSANFNIGLRNANIAKEMLDEYRIPIIASSVGGSKGRKILFFTDSGEVLMKYIEKTVVNAM